MQKTDRLTDQKPRVKKQDTGPDWKADIILLESGAMRMNMVDGAIIPIVQRDSKSPATEVIFHTTEEILRSHRCPWALQLYRLKHNLCIREINGPLLFLIVRYVPNLSGDEKGETPKAGRTDSGN